MKNRTTEQRKQARILGKGAGINLLSKLFGRALHVLGQVLLARWLGPALFGLYAIGWNILRVATILLPLGLDNGIIQAASAKWPGDKVATRRLVTTSLVITFLVGAIAGAVVFLASPWIASIFGKPDFAPVLQGLAYAIPFASGLKVAASATRVTQWMRYGILAEEIAQPLVNLLLIALLFVTGLQLAGAVMASVVSFVVGFGLAILSVGRLFGFGLFAADKRLPEARKLLANSLPVGAATIFATAILIVDRILVGYFLSEEAAGIYQSISLFSVFFVTILSAFKIIVAPMIAKLHSNNDRKGLEDLFRVSTRWVLYLSLPAAVVILLTAENALGFIFGTSYVAGALSLTVLVYAQLANSATGAIEHFLIMTNNQRSWLAISGFSFFVNIVLNLLLIPTLGLPGAAIATLVTFSLMSVFALVQVKSRVQIWPYDRNYFKGAAATFAMIVVLWVLSNWQFGGPILQIGAMGVAAYAVFALVLVLLGLEPEDKQILAIIANRVRQDTK